MVLVVMKKKKQMRSMKKVNVDVMQAVIILVACLFQASWFWKLIISLKIFGYKEKKNSSFDSIILVFVILQ